MPHADIRKTPRPRSPRVPRGAEAVLFLSTIVAILQCISLVVLLPVTSELGRAGYAPLDQASLDRATDALDVWGNVELLALGTVVVAWIVTSVWLTSCRSFAIARNEEARFSLSAAWAWLGWVVPVVAYWFPRRVVRDVWTSSVTDAAATTKNPVGAWWGTWLTASILWGLQVYTLPTTLESGGGSLVPSELLTTIFMLVALRQWWRVVQGIQSAQHKALRIGS